MKKKYENPACKVFTVNTNHLCDLSNVQYREGDASNGGSQEGGGDGLAKDDLDFGW